MMFYLNAFSSVFSLITLVHTRELGPFVRFIMKHPSIHLHFWLFSICSTIGQVHTSMCLEKNYIYAPSHPAIVINSTIYIQTQLFIFYTIKTFGPVVFAIIMSTRILLSIAASCFLYGHPVPPLGTYVHTYILTGWGRRFIPLFSI